MRGSPASCEQSQREKGSGAMIINSDQCPDHNRALRAFVVRALVCVLALAASLLVSNQALAAYPSSPPSAAKNSLPDNPLLTPTLTPTADPSEPEYPILRHVQDA